MRDWIPLLVLCVISGLPLNLTAASDVYSIGNPTDAEQLQVEFINRARADALAEAQRLAASTDHAVLSALCNFAVDLEQMRLQFEALTQYTQPLALNALLTDAARLHAQDMLVNVFQGHDSSSNAPSGVPRGSGIAERADQAGYNFSTLRENVFAFGANPWHIHAGFNIDWGNGPFGIQTPAGHRISIHTANIREVGMAVLEDARTVAERPTGVVLADGTPNPTGGSVGPFIVAQLFGSSLTHNKPFLTGVAYTDMDGDDFYSEGEGVSGVRVVVEGADFEAQTTLSGGYSLPLPGNGTYTAVFYDGAVELARETFTVDDGLNVKLDLAVGFETPLPDYLVALRRNRLDASRLPGTSASELRLIPLDANPFIDGAELGLERLLPDIWPAASYTATTTARKRSGSRAYHLAHPDSQPGVEDRDQFEQYLDFPAALYVEAGAQLRYYDMVRLATLDQSGMVELSTDGGATWVVIDTRRGRYDPSLQNFNDVDTSFQEQTVSLEAYAGQVVDLRFVYRTLTRAERSEALCGSGGTSVFRGTDASFGWFIDDVSLQNVQLLDAHQSAFTDASGAAGVNGLIAGTRYVVQARPDKAERPTGFSGPVLLETLAVNAAPLEPTSSGGVSHDPRLGLLTWHPEQWVDAARFGRLQIGGWPHLYFQQRGWHHFRDRADARTTVWYDLEQQRWVFFADDAPGYAYPLGSPTQRWERP